MPLTGDATSYSSHNVHKIFAKLFHYTKMLAWRRQFAGIRIQVTSLKPFKAIAVVWLLNGKVTVEDMAKVDMILWGNAQWMKTRTNRNKNRSSVKQYKWTVMKMFSLFVWNVTQIKICILIALAIHFLFSSQLSWFYPSFFSFFYTFDFLTSFSITQPIGLLYLWQLCFTSPHLLMVIFI